MAISKELSYTYLLIVQIFTTFYGNMAILFQKLSLAWYNLRNNFHFHHFVIPLGHFLAKILRYLSKNE